MDMFTLEQLDPTHHPLVVTAIGAAKKWQRDRKTSRFASLVLMSAADPKNKDATGYGTGKTHIAKACYHTDLYYYNDGDKWVPHCPAGKFYEANVIIQAAGAGYFLDVRKGNILVIDDIGTEKTIPFVAAVDQAGEIVDRYTGIVDKCYTVGISLILTSNLQLGDFKRHIGGRAWSRLQQMAGPGCIVDMTGVTDYRLKLRV